MNKNCHVSLEKKSNISRTTAVILAVIMTSLMFVSYIPAVYANNSTENQEVEALHFSTAPNIDGYITTAEWGNPTFTASSADAATTKDTRVYNNLMFYDNGRSTPLNMTGWLRWDADYFYVGLKVQDTDGHMLKSTKNETWNGDAVQFRVDPDGANAATDGDPFNFTTSSKPWGSYCKNDFVVGYCQAAGGYTEVWNNYGSSTGTGLTSFSTNTNPVQAAVAPCATSGTTYSSYSSDAASGITTYEIAIPWIYIETSDYPNIADHSDINACDGLEYGMSLALFNGTPGGKAFNEFLCWGSGCLGEGGNGEYNYNAMFKDSSAGSNAVFLSKTDAGGSPTSLTTGGPAGATRDVSNWDNFNSNYYFKTVNGYSKDTLDFNDPDDLNIFGGETEVEGKLYSGQRIQDSDGNWVLRFGKNFDNYENPESGYNTLIYLDCKSRTATGDIITQKYPANVTFETKIKVTGTDTFQDGYDPAIDFQFGGINGVSYEAGYNFTDSAFELGTNIESTTDKGLISKISCDFSKDTWHTLTFKYDNNSYAMKLYFDDALIFSEYNRYFYYTNLDSDTGYGYNAILRRINIQCDLDDVTLSNIFGDNKPIPVDPLPDPTDTETATTPIITTGTPITTEPADSTTDSAGTLARKVYYDAQKYGNVSNLSFEIKVNTSKLSFQYIEGLTPEQYKIKDKGNGTYILEITDPDSIKKLSDGQEIFSVIVKPLNGESITETDILDDSLISIEPIISSVPSTGDTAFYVLCAMLALTASTSVTACIVYKKRKHTEN